MERAAFLIEESQRRPSGARLSCLLNPNTLVFRRVAGLRPRRSLAGAITQGGLRDDPLIQTGGGFTELRLDLLFDVNIPGTWLGNVSRSSTRAVEREPLQRATGTGESDIGGGGPAGGAGTGDPGDTAGGDARRRAQAPREIRTREEEDLDVRDLTRPLWELAENQERPGAAAGPPRVLFVWGKKVWDFPAVVAAVAERLENFTARGIPQRSFLRLRLLRADDRVEPEEMPSPTMLMATEPEFEPEAISPLDVLPIDEQAPPETYESYVSPGDALFLTAFRFFGDASLWDLIAGANPDIDPVFVPPGTVLRIPTSAKSVLP